MSVVNLIPQNIIKKDQKLSKLLRERTSVYFLNAKKKNIAFEIAKKNMKLAAQKLDW